MMAEAFVNGYLTENSENSENSVKTAFSNKKPSKNRQENSQKNSQKNSQNSTFLNSRHRSLRMFSRLLK